jgi:hypothetical protein
MDGPRVVLEAPATGAHDLQGDLMSGSTQEITTDDARELVQRAGGLLRARPPVGLGPDEVAAWHQSVDDFLHSPTIQLALAWTGVVRAEGAPGPTDDLAAFYVALDNALDNRVDSPIAVVVATVVAGAITGLVAGRGADLEPDPLPEPTAD